MGTSRNDPSPPIPPWKPALAVLGRTDVPAERQSLEIWRAVAADRGERLLRDLANPTLAEACSLIAKGRSVSDALDAYDEATLHIADVGLAVDLGRRALARAAVNSSGPSGFASELFAEAVSYYASRDLPSFVAAPGRIANSSAALDLKENLRKIARKTASQAGEPPLDRRGWHRYVSRVLTALQGRERLPR
ncbi:MAG: hypothetical protein ACR2JB_23890 [Bryobacteraceae bacterium]